MAFLKIDDTYIPIQKKKPIKVYDLGNGKFELVYAKDTAHENVVVINKRELVIIDSIEGN